MEEEKAKSLGKKILTVIISVIITIIVLFFIVFSWVLIKNPLNVRGILLYKLGWIDTPVKIVPTANITGGTADSADDTGITIPDINALPITPEQRQVIEDFGIDPDSVVITPAMGECFIEKLGRERAEEIINGATPGTLEIFKASSCL